MRARAINGTIQHALRQLSSMGRGANWVCGPCRRQIQGRRLFATASTKLSEKPYYITTPIFYVNADPHVGHLYTMVLADIMKRWHALRGRKAILMTGTDEHGMKVQQASAIAGVDPKSFCDKGAEVFKRLAARAEISVDKFIRTTDSDHKETVAYAWHLLKERDYIYTSKHEGWYSVSDETFFPESGVHLIVEPQTGRKIMASIETGNEVGWTSEINHKFRLSAFRDRLLEFYRKNPQWIIPEPRMNNVVYALTQGLDDISISRPASRLTWGIPVPGDDSQTIYVWLDALVNYLTTAGYPWPPGQEHAGGWPADCHVIGKDIVRFHCVYWPAFLMALDLPLPERILSHAHWTLGRTKISKSRGNVVNPFFALDRFGVDIMRFYLALEGGIKNDTDYGNQTIISRHKSTLQGLLGNLTSRLLRGKGWNVREAIVNTVPQIRNTGLSGNEFLSRLDELAAEVNGCIEQVNASAALRAIFAQIDRANVHFATSSPWRIVKGSQIMAETSESRSVKETHNPDYVKMPQNPFTGSKPLDLDTIIYNTIETLRIAGILMQPFMPGKAAQLLDMLGVAPDRRSYDDARVGVDGDYGVSAVPLGKGISGVLFPPLSSDR